MADPTARVDLTYSDIDVGRGDYVITSGVALVVGAHVSLILSTGKIDFSGTNADAPVGFVLGSADGNNANLTGNAGGTNRAITRGDIDVEVNVVGASAVTDVNDEVFAVDGQTFSKTNPDAALPCGIIKRYISGTKCLVHFFSLQESYLKV